MQLFRDVLVILRTVLLFGGWPVLAIWLCMKGDAPGPVTAVLAAAPIIFAIYLGALRPPRTPRIHPDLRSPPSVHQPFSRANQRSLRR